MTIINEQMLLNKLADFFKSSPVSQRLEYFLTARVLEENTHGFFNDAASVQKFLEGAKQELHSISEQGVLNRGKLSKRFIHSVRHVTEEGVDAFAFIGDLNQKLGRGSLTRDDVYEGMNSVFDATGQEAMEKSLLESLPKPGVWERVTDRAQEMRQGYEQFASTNRLAGGFLAATEIGVGAMWFMESGKKLLNSMNGKPPEGEKQATLSEKIWLAAQAVAAAGLTAVGIHTARLAYQGPKQLQL